MSKTTISITHYNLVHTTEIPNDSSIDVAIDAICGLLVLAGWHRESVERGIIEKAEEINEEQQKNDEVPRPS